MFQTKYQIHKFSLYEYAAVEEHLTKMAAKGWRIERVNNFAWKFKKAEPANVTYSVTYLPKLSDFDPEPRLEQRTMEAFCVEAGWKKACNWMQMQIFYSKNPEVVPLETDEELRLSMIEKTMRKGFLLGNLMLLFMFLFLGYMQYTTAERDFVSFFAQSDKLWLIGLLVFGFVAAVLEILYYFFWLHRAKKAVAEGRKLPKTRLHTVFTKISWYLLGILLIGYVTSLSGWFAAVWIGYMAAMFGIMAVLRKVQEKLRNAGVSKGMNIFLFLVADVVLVCSLIGILTFIMWNFVVDSEKDAPPAYYTGIGGREWSLYRDDIPLTTKDFYAETDAYYPDDASTSYKIVEESSSLLLSYGDYRQRSYLTEHNTPGIYYQTIEVKATFLYDFFLDAFLEKQFRYNNEIRNKEYQLQETSLGEGVSLYRLCSKRKGDFYNDWLILTDTQIIKLESDVELTMEQLQVVVNKLVK